ncbi:copper resistance protein B [Luteimonas mephitis]|uniref:copper resistance protein B n=1 Tax=Luteimonas mephitis TaxID=83615 RepID=UPI000402B9C8|nr:copper resistance protein B [Luteimonas mephitis]
MTYKTPRLHALALALAIVSAPSLAQQTDHSEHTSAASSESGPEDPHAGHAMPMQEAAEATQQATEVDHAAMGHAMPATPPTAPVDHSAHVMPKPQEATAEEATEESADQAAMDHSETDHSQMDHSSMQEMDHSQMDHSSMQGMDHSTMEGMDHSAMNQDLPADAEPRDPIPPVTPADRAAAFPGGAGHAVHDKGIHSYALLDRLETWDADESGAVAWEALGWVGTDLDRLWVRSEGEAIDGDVESGDVEVLYGRAIARWWDAVVGVRHDFGEGPSQTLAAIGVMGLAPYKFEVDATAYVGQGGQTGLSVAAEYETLFTNRLIGQWLVEAEAWGEDDPQRGIGSGLSTLEAGFRLRYEFHRQFAPYIGVTWERAYGGTADLRRADGEDIDDTRVVAGVRIWF